MPFLVCQEPAAPFGAALVALRLCARDPGRAPGLCAGPLLAAAPAASARRTGDVRSAALGQAMRPAAACLCASSKCASLRKLTAAECSAGRAKPRDMPGLGRGSGRSSHSQAIANPSRARSAPCS